MPSDHARIHLDIWGDDDWLDLPADAQCLYMTLYTSPGRTLCGSHEWNVGKIRQRAADWTAERIESAAEILSQRMFLVIDIETSECLLRSWIKHDGLWRTPNMAVSVANARAALASRTLRGVIVFEVAKLRDAEPKSSSWGRDAVQSMLKQKAVDPATLQPFSAVANSAHNPAPNGHSNGGYNGAANPYGHPGVKGAPNGGPTIAISTIATTTERDDDESSAVDPNPPKHIDNAARPAKQHPSDAARTVVRQTLGDAGYPRNTIDRLAVQVGKLAPEHPDQLIREALIEWDRRPGCERPEFLPTVLSDVVKRSRAAPQKRGTSKLRDLAELAAEERAREQDQFQTTTARKELG